MNTLIPNTSPKIANITNTLQFIGLLQDLLGHPEVFLASLLDPQESHLHLKRCKKKGVNIPHYLVGCLTPKGLIGITNFQVDTKETFH